MQSNSTPTPHRVKHDPQPRQPGVPATMRVAVEVGFVQSCPDCRAIVSQLAATCIGDPSVTAFRALPGRKHAHDTAEGSQSLPGLTSAPQRPAEPAEAIHAERLAVSDTNGDDPADVEAALFAIDDPLNGFDPEVRN